MTVLGTSDGLSCAADGSTFAGSSAAVTAGVGVGAGAGAGGDTAVGDAISGATGTAVVMEVDDVAGAGASLRACGAGWEAVREEILLRALSDHIQ